MSQMDANKRNNAGFDPKKPTECLTGEKNRQLLAGSCFCLAGWAFGDSGTG